jgi:hypothetical protein
MSKEDLDALLESMPKIAEAVNAFSSEAVRQEAFKAMVAAFSGEKSGHKERVIHVSKPHDDEQDVEEIDQGQSDERRQSRREADHARQLGAHSGKRSGRGKACFLNSTFHAQHERFSCLDGPRGRPWLAP